MEQSCLTQWRMSTSQDILRDKGVNGMIRGTTPTIKLYVDGYDLTGMRFYITLCDKKNDQKFTYDNTMSNVELVSASSEQSQINLTLSQEETLDLAVGKVEIQVRWIDRYGIADATDIAVIDVSKVLLDKKIDFGGVV